MKQTMRIVYKAQDHYQNKQSKKINIKRKKQEEMERQREKELKYEKQEKLKLMSL